MGDLRKPETSVVYPGTFDPITLGHQDLIKRALKLFDRCYIAISTAYGKQSLFTAEERLLLIQEIYADNSAVTVEIFDGLIVDYAKQKNTNALLRGLRAVSDFEYEMQMAGMNRYLSMISENDSGEGGQQVETLFLMPSKAYMSVSSSVIRGIATIDPRRIETLVHPVILSALMLRAGQG